MNRQRLGPLLILLLLLPPVLVSGRGPFGQLRPTKAAAAAAARSTALPASSGSKTTPVVVFLAPAGHGADIGESEPTRRTRDCCCCREGACSMGGGGGRRWERRKLCGCGEGAGRGSRGTRTPRTAGTLLRRKGGSGWSAASSWGASAVVFVPTVVGPFSCAIGLTLNF